MPRDLASLLPHDGHGKVWHRVLAGLRESAKIVAIEADGRRSRLSPQGPSVVLANGHADLPTTRVPLVVQVHEAGWFDPALREHLNADFLGFIASRTERSVRAAAHVITPSRAARRDLIASYGLDPARVHAIHHGVDRTFGPSAAGGRALVARARGGRDAPYVLYAATLHPRKNLAALRQAMVGLAAAGLPQVLAIAGRPAPDRPDSSDLERAAAAELAGAPDRIVRLGEPSDRELAALMAEADAFCLPSLYEGFGLSVLEAMACGAPVVVSDRGALPEVVGEAGLVVEPTPGAVLEALHYLLVDRSAAERLGRAAAERASAFSWERTAAGWLSILRTASGAASSTRGRRP